MITMDIRVKILVLKVSNCAFSSIDIGIWIITDTIPYIHTALGFTFLSTWRVFVFVALK